MPVGADVPVGVDVLAGADALVGVVVLVGVDGPTGCSLDDGVTAQPHSKATTATVSPHEVLMSRTYPAGCAVPDPSLERDRAAVDLFGEYRHLTAASKQPKHTRHRAAGAANGEPVAVVHRYPDPASFGVDTLVSPGDACRRKWAPVTSRQFPAEPSRPGVILGVLVASQMPYLEFLARLHTALRPETYLEIGVHLGQSLALARTRAIGIDPAYSITAPLSCDLSLFRTTSDEYFSRPEPLAPFSGAPVDLAFIDGMHLFDFALRDFINVERVSRPSSAIVLDDVFPRTVLEANRNQQTKSWTGDVYKIVEVLRQYRPDLTLTMADTWPTGLLLVTGLNPESPVLKDRYDEIIEKYVTEDPQDVPPAIFAREGAVDPETLLRSPVWGALRRSRRPWVGAERARSEMVEALQHPDGYRARRRRLRRAATRTLTSAARQMRTIRSR
jgi:hypothetical protein